MEMYDIKVVKYEGRPLFQSAKMVSPTSLKNTLEDIACFFFVQKGSGHFIESHGTHKVSKNEGLIKSCGNFISNYFKDQEDNDFEATVIYFYPDILKEIYTELADIIFPNGETVPPKKIAGNELVEKFVQGLHLYFESSELMDERLSRLKLKELIMILLRSDYYESVTELFEGLFPQGNKSFRMVIENNLTSNLSLDELAFLTHRSLSTFKRDFKKEFNESPARYMKKKRLELASRLISTTGKSVSEIAYECGFQDLSTFSFVFKEMYAVSPSEYRLTRNGKSLA